MALTVTDRLRVTHALRSRSFTLLLTGQTISTFGDVVYEIALTWQMLTLTHSAATLGIILTAVIVPKLLFLLVGGVVADRLPRRLVMLWSDSGRAIVMFLIVLLGWTHLLQFWHLVLLALFFGFVDGFFFPAYQAILPQFVDVDTLTSANTLQSLSMRMSRICGAFLGAGFITLAGPISAFAFDGVTFVISACCLLAIHIPEAALLPPQKADRVAHKRPSISQIRQQIDNTGKQLHAGIREGVQYVFGLPWLWIMLLIAAGGNIILDTSLSLAIPKLTLDIDKLGVWVYGEQRTALAIGSIAGILLVGQLPRLRHRGVLLNLAVIISNLALIVLGLPFPGNSMAVVIQQYWEELGHHRFEHIRAALKIQREEVEDAFLFIRANLHPYPAHHYYAQTGGTSSSSMPAIPSVLIHKNAAAACGYEVEVIESQRFFLRINPLYQDMRRNTAMALSPGELDHITHFLERSRLFLSQLRRRQILLHKVSSYLIEYQRDFLDRGTLALRPLTQKTVAETLGVHVSTISRAIASKFAQLPSQEILPLSRFFSAELRVQELIHQLIANETTPLSDERIARHLKQEYGITLSRQMVANYRTELRLPAARQRALLRGSKNVAGSNTMHANN